jgi:hypothetical protein
LKVISSTRSTNFGAPRRVMRLDGHARAGHPAGDEDDGARGGAEVDESARADGAARTGAAPRDVHVAGPIDLQRAQAGRVEPLIAAREHLRRGDDLARRDGSPEVHARRRQPADGAALDQKGDVVEPPRLEDHARQVLGPAGADVDVRALLHVGEERVRGQANVRTVLVAVIARPRKGARRRRPYPHAPSP